MICRDHVTRGWKLFIRGHVTPHSRAGLQITIKGSTNLTLNFTLNVLVLVNDHQ